jgi:hypothetical protein
LFIFTYGFTNCGAISFTPVTLRAQNPSPVMRAATSRHAELTAWLDVTLQVRDSADPLQTLAPGRTLCAIDALHPEYLLGQVHTHVRKLHVDPSSFRDW